MKLAATVVILMVMPAAMVTRHASAHAQIEGRVRVIVRSKSPNNTHETPAAMPTALAAGNHCSRCGTWVKLHA